MEMSGSAGPRVLFVTLTCYLDTANGATVASRAMMECLARQGFPAAAMTGTVFESSHSEDLPALLNAHGWTAAGGPDGDGRSPHPAGAYHPAPLRREVRGVDVTLHTSSSTSPHPPDEAEIRGFLRLLDETMGRFRPDVVVTYGGDALGAGIQGVARARGAAIVFALHNFLYASRKPFEAVDAIIVPSRFAASYYRRTLGIECTPLPNLIDIDRVRSADRDPRYVTFVNPSPEKGVYVFARIADELGRKRPDIPLLVVEARGNERTLVDCGPDLRTHGNVFLMGHTSDPRRFWRVTRLCLMPSLWWENQPLVAIEAMINGVPVIASDRGGIPEALGDAGLVLGIPPRLTPITCELPTAMEVEPWVKAVIALWDDRDWYDEQSRRAAAESRRWAPDVLEPQYLRFFQGVRRFAAVKERADAPSP